MGGTVSHQVTGTGSRALATASSPCSGPWIFITLALGSAILDRSGEARISRERGASPRSGPYPFPLQWRNRPN
jgi:hypothetical protein